MAEQPSSALPLTSSLSLSSSGSPASTRVQVSVRVRPRNKHDAPQDKIAVKGYDKQVLVGNGEDTRGRRSYTFDHVFTGDQATLFDAIGQNMLREAYAGFNVCLIAYGQTGSGKTYSIFGEPHDAERAGLAPRFVRCLFDEAQRLVEEDADLTVRVTLSMIEVYMEKVRDLLAPRTRGQEPESLDIREDAQHRVYVKGAGVHPVLSYERMMELLRRGNANRQTAETRMNETSSRSHAILQIGVLQEYKSIEKKDLESVVTLVDLAGSERQSKAESSGQHFEEAKKINHSLLMLGRALNAFSERRGTEAYISLRESKLTRLLSESFGGNSKTWMLATVSPTAYNLSETVSTLEYASNAMAITNKARVNNSYKNLELKELKLVVAHLERQLDNLVCIRKTRELECAERAEWCAALRKAVDEARAHRATHEALLQSCRTVALANVTLQRRIEAASHRLLRALDSEGACAYYKGRCGLSLASVLRGVACACTLPLHTDAGAATSTLLTVHLLPVGDTACARADVYELAGRDVNFCLRVVGADKVPESCAARTFCRVSLRYDHQDRYFTTTACQHTSSPRWDFAQQFMLPALTRDVIACFDTQHLFTFEVFGFST